MSDEIQIPVEEENLRDLNDWAEKDWYNILGRQPRFMLHWQTQEWQSYGWLLHHAICRILGRGQEGPDKRHTVTVLELGFGVGRGLDHLVNEFHVPAELITAAEVLEYRVEEAKKNFPGVTVVQLGPRYGDLMNWIDSMRESGAAFELIVARQVMQRIPYPDKVLANLAGLLVEGGVFAMTVPPVGAQVDGPAMFQDLPIRFEDKAIAQEQQKAAGLDGFKLATRHFASPLRRFRKGWLPMLQAAKLEPVEFGQRKHRALRKYREQFAFCRRVT